MIPALKVWFIIRPVEFYLLVAWKMQLNHLDVSSSLYLSFSCFETNSWRVLGDLMEYVFWIVSFDLWFYYYYFFLFSTGVNYPLRVLGVQVHFYWSGRGGVGVGERRKKIKKKRKERWWVPSVMMVQADRVGLVAAMWPWNIQRSAASFAWQMGHLPIPTASLHLVVDAKRALARWRQICDVSSSAAIP